MTEGASAWPPARVAYAPDPRLEMVPFVPAAATTVLDVGTAHGAFGGALRAARPQLVITGIEPALRAYPTPAGYDRLVEGSFPDDLAPDDRFDCIVCNDVLEHVVDPWTTLARARPHLEVGGVVVASIPNVRYLRVSLPLLLRGRWTYQDRGVLDRTHLRFFTPSSMRTLFEQSGFVVDVLEGINPMRRYGLGTIDRATGGRLHPLVCQQYAIVGRPLGAGDAPAHGRPR